MLHGKYCIFTLSGAMGRNYCTYGDGSGGHCHKGEVAEDQGINLGVGRPCSRRQASSKVIREDLGFSGLCISNLKVDDSLSQRTPPHHRWVETWER